MKRLKRVLKVMFVLFCFIMLIGIDRVDSHTYSQVITDAKTQALINQESNK